MRKALCIGIDDYKSIAKLGGCVNDAKQMHARLQRHADGSVNFGAGAKLLVAETAAEGEEETPVLTAQKLKDEIRELFSGDGEIAILFFAGHGYVESSAL